MNQKKNRTEEEIHIEQGDALYKENLYEEAIAEYNNALKINPGNLLAQLKIAKAKLSASNLKVDYSGETPPVTLKAAGLEVTAQGPGRRPGLFKYIAPVVIIIAFAVWYIIDARESKIGTVGQESTSDVNFKMSPEGADLIFGTSEKPEADSSTEPVKTGTDQKLTKSNREDAAKNDTAKKVGTKRPATKERLAKKEKGTSRKLEAGKAEKPGFWAAIKEYILSFFKGSGRKEQDGKGVIRDPLGAEE